MTHKSENKIFKFQKDKPKKAENNLKVHHGIKNLDKGNVLTVRLEPVIEESRVTEAELEAEFTAREVLDTLIADEAVGGQVDESLDTSQSLAERGIPKRVVQGRLQATNAGYVQLKELTERRLTTPCVHDKNIFIIFKHYGV